jgi:hypothetical protein
MDTKIVVLTGEIKDLEEGLTLEYRKFDLTSGESSKCLLDGSVVWIGKEGFWRWVKH